MVGILAETVLQGGGEVMGVIPKDLPDGKKAGQEIRLRGASFFTISNGRISRLVDYM